MNAKLEQNLRLYSGLFIAFFLVLHLLNAALGIISIAAMNKMGGVLFKFWSVPLFGLMLYGAFAVHICLTFVSLYRRRSLRLPFWSAFQIVLGLALPTLLVGHIMGTRGVDIVLDVQRNYSIVVTSLWSSLDRTLEQYALLLIAWTHMSFGIHFWLRYKSSYRQWVPLLYPLSLIIPLLAILGFTRAGFESKQIVEQSEAFIKTREAFRQADPALREFLQRTGDQILAFLALMLLVLVVIHLVRRWVPLNSGRINVFHTGRGKPIKAKHGQTILEVLREANIPHAAVCGGRGRCTTCRVRVGKGFAKLPRPGSLEANALKRVQARPNVRLACQIRPTHDVTITPLLRPNDEVPGADLNTSVVGHEQQVVCMFVDMRRSTELGEQKLPFDVVFILNQFFSQLSEALSATKGHYASFTGDGLMALYGLTTDLETGCRDAIRGAIDIQRRIDSLNKWLSDELKLPLQFGIGIHCGEAIVGTMGPPETPVLNAIGDTINITARLEALTKKYDAQMVVSEVVLRHANIEAPNLPRHSEIVKGRGESVAFVVIKEPKMLSEFVLEK